MTKDRPPLADGSDSSMDTLSKLHPRCDGSVTQMVGMDDSMRNYLELGEAIKRLKAQQDEVKAQLCQSLGDKSVGRGLDYSFSWKSQSTRRMNTKRFQADYPDLFEEYAETTVSRTFRVKKNK